MDDKLTKVIQLCRQSIMRACAHRNLYTVNEFLAEFDSRVAEITQSEGPSKTKLPASPDAGGGPNSQKTSAELSLAELNLVRQWFNATDDAAPQYLEAADRELMAKIMAVIRGGEDKMEPVFDGPDPNIGPPHWGKTTQG